MEAFETLYSSTGATLSPLSYQYPSQSSLSVLSVSASEYADPIASLPSCPLNYNVFAPLAALNTVPLVSYQACGQAVSSATSSAAPWSQAVSAQLTVSPFPTYSATTGQWSFAVQSLTSGGYSQQLQTANSSALVTGSSGSPSLYLQSNGAFSLDTTGVTLALQSSVALPSSSSTAHATNTLTVAGVVPATSALTPGSLTAFTSLSAPWTVRLIPGLAFVRHPFTYINTAGAVATAPGGTSLLMYGGQLNTTVLYNDVYLSTDSGVTFNPIAGPAATAAQNALYTSPFVEYDGCIKIQDGKGRLYAISGNYTSVLQYSDDALNWTTVSVPFHGRAYTFATADPLGNLFVMGGQGAVDDHTGASGTYLNDVYANTDIPQHTHTHSPTRTSLVVADVPCCRPPVCCCCISWMSSTQGLTWQQQTAAAAWDIRDSMMGVSFFSTQLQKVVIVHSGGHDDTTLNFRPNEVWGSSDQGVSWTLFPRAPYVGRNHASMQVASNGVMVVVAGKTDVVTGSDANTGFNDIFARGDGCMAQQTDLFVWHQTTHPACLPEPWDSRDTSTITVTKQRWCCQHHTNQNK